MILAGRQRQNMFAVDHHDETRFFADQKFFDDHARAGRAELVAGEHKVDRAMGFFNRHRDHDAFAGRQAIGFNHNWHTEAIDVGVRLGEIGRGFGIRGRNVMALHEALGIIFGTFQLRRRASRAEYAQLGIAKRIDHAGGKRRFGADHG